MERMFLHSWYHIQRRREADVVLIAHAQVWPWAFTFPVWYVYEWLFCLCLIQRAQTEEHLNISSPFPPQWHAISLGAHHGCVTSYYFLTSSIFMIVCFHGIQKWGHQRLMYSLCTPPLLRRSHKMSLFGSVNVWEAALYFRLWWNLERSEVGVLWWSHASRLRWLFESRLASSICRWCCGGRPCFCVGKTDPIQTSILHVQA